MSIVGGLDIHRKQITFDYPGTATGELERGQIAPADRAHLAGWLARRFAGGQDAQFAMEGCTGWRYVSGELTAAGLTPHVGEPAETAAARGPKKRAKTDKADARHLRELLAQGRLPECWVPPSHVLECRALLELYHDLRTGHTAWVQRIHAVCLGCPAFSGQLNWYYFMLRAAGSGTRRGLLAESYSRVLSGDVSYCTGARCTAQYPRLLFSLSGR